jgi:hypothetical protein
MNKRSTTLVVGTALLVGCVVGASSAYFSTHRTAKASVLKQMTAVMATEHLWHAQLMRNGKHDQVLSLLEGTLPDTVRWYSAFGYRTPSDIRLLWRIRDHCSQHHISLPSEIQEILDSLPARPPLVCATDGATVVEPGGPTNGSQPIRSETDPMSSVAGSRR